MGSNIPKIGASDIEGCYLGSDEIEKVYLGSDLIYEKSVTPTEPSYTWTFDSVFGSPTNVGGVYSGFSTSDYLQIYTKNVTTTDIEFNLNFTTGSTISWQSLFTSSGEYAPEFYMAPQIQIGTNGKITFRASDTSSPSGWGVNISSNVTLSPETNYTFNAILNSGTLTCKLMDSSNNIIDTFSDSISEIAWYYNVNIGTGSTISTAHFEGSLNTKKSYIKINGNLISNITQD